MEAPLRGDGVTAVDYDEIEREETLFSLAVLIALVLVLAVTLVVNQTTRGF